MPVTKNDLYHFVRWKFFHTTFYSIPALRSVTDGPGDAAFDAPVFQVRDRALHHQAAISSSDRNEELSRIWRIRAVRAAHAGNQALAEQTLKELEASANKSRNRVIQASYEGAAGTLLMDSKKYQEAIAHLEEDQDNPFSMELLVQAYYQTSQPEKVHEIEVKLRATNMPTMEQALVVPAARSRKPTS